MNSRFTGYRVTSQVHHGRRTQVLRARRVRDNRPVILKTVRHEHPPIRDVARLRHEFTLLKKLDVPGVVSALELLGSGSRPALVLEDFEGESLRRKIPPQGLALDDFFWVAKAAVKALGHIHSANILHKDIKPDNLIVHFDRRQLAIADFSIASQLSEERLSSQTFNILEGSLAYLSPEQTGRMNRPVDYRSDYYSLGVTFYELLCGELPFQVTDTLELLHAHIARHPLSPKERRPNLPAPLAGLVMHLLEKQPENRYQSTEGLLTDLRLIEQGVDDTFVVGRHETHERFVIASTLVGRSRELKSLGDAYDRACLGSNECVLIGGPAGIGKSVLVHELQRTMAVRRGAFVAGKFDALAHISPYAALATALRTLINQTLGAPERELEMWRTTVCAAVGGSGQLLVELIPELEVLLGPQPPVPAMPPTESANRFHNVLRAFMISLAREDRPLTVFLDDLQWSDLATLKLIEDLATDFELAHILWIGTYRDGEVSASHPLTRVLQALRDAEVGLTEIALTPLSVENVCTWVSATLHSEPAAVFEFAQRIHHLSRGNPFFVRAVLSKLHELGAIYFDPKNASWAWSLAAVDTAKLPDDVAALVTERIHEQDETCRRLLETAAAVGGHFDIHLLGQLLSTTPAAVLDNLWPAVSAGLVRPVGDDYKFIRDETRRAEFEFVHDRVQQAAYQLLDADKRATIHIDIGRRLLLADNADDESNLFIIAGHFAAAGPIAKDPAIAELLVRAALRAKVSTAYHEACGFLAAAVGFLGAQAWEQHPALKWKLERARVECEYLAGHPEQAVKIFVPLLEHTSLPRDRAMLYALRATLETNRGDLVTALQSGRSGLRALRRRLPKNATTLSVLKAFAAFKRLHRGPAAAILELPELDNRDREAELRVLMSMAAAAYFVDTNLASVILLRIANLSMRHGLCDISAYGFVGVGLVMSGAFGHYREAHELAQIARSLNERYNNTELAAKIILFSTTFMGVWVQPFTEVKQDLRLATETGFANGDFIYGIYSTVTEAFLMVIDGSCLARVVEHCSEILPVVRRRQLADQTATIRYMLHLFGRVLPGTKESDGRGPFDEEAFRAGISDESTPLVMFYYHYYEVIRCYLAMDNDGAMAALNMARSRTKVAFGSAIIADFYFYECLVLTRVIPTATRPRKLRRRVKQRLRSLKTWARTAPSNYGSRATLVEAELARVGGDEGGAMRLYNRAIAEARQHEMPHIEALAAECALRYAHRLQYPILTRAYAAEAILAYRSWGALAKVQQLANEFEGFVQQRPDAADSITTTHSSSPQTRATTTVALDLDTVIKASRAISSELALDRLLSRLTTLLVENAGASRGVLLLRLEDELRVEAEAVSTTSGVEVTVNQKLPLTDELQLPHSIINRVRRAHKDIVLNDAKLDPVHSQDPHIIASSVRSLMCFALMHQGELLGIVYLENNLATGAFTIRRISLIRQLAAQIAISLTNAHLYARLNEARLAALVADRVKTRFLMNMSHELRTPLNAILGYTELMSESLQHGETEGFDSDLRSIHRAGIRLLRSVSSLLELTRIEADARATKYEEIDLRKLVDGLLVAFADSAARSGNTLREQLPSQLPRLQSDEHMLHYCLTTLLDNACRFTSDGVVELQVSSTTRNERPWVNFAVSDNGPGIDDDARSNLFTAFYQVDDSPSRKFEGTGVSLAVAARFVDRLGGRISVESEVGRGSTFTISLPEAVE